MPPARKETGNPGRLDRLQISPFFHTFFPVRTALGLRKGSRSVLVPTHLECLVISFPISLEGWTGINPPTRNALTFGDFAPEACPFCLSARTKAALELARERSALANYRDVLLRLVPFGGTNKMMVMATCGVNQDQDLDWYLDAPKDHVLLDIRPFNWWQHQVDLVKSPKIRHRIRELLEQAEGHLASLTSLALSREEAAKLHKVVRIFTLLKRAQFEETKFRSLMPSNMAFLDKTPWDDPSTSPNQWAPMIDLWEKDDKVFSKVAPKGRRGPEIPKGDYQSKPANPQKNFTPRKPSPKFSKKRNKRPNDGKCFKCGQLGHIQRNCPQQKGQAKRAMDPASG